MRSFDDIGATAMNTTRSNVMVRLGRGCVTRPAGHPGLTKGRQERGVVGAIRRSVEKLLRIGTDAGALVRCATANQSPNRRRAGMPLRKEVPTSPSAPAAVSGRLGDRLGCLDGVHVEIEERFLLVSLLLVLLANADHFPQHLDVEAIALRFRKDLPLGLVQFLDFLVDVLDALDDGPQLITWNVGRSAHGLLLVNTTAETSCIRADASRRASSRGKQSVNVVPICPERRAWNGRPPGAASAF